jgi:hypothetical protein
MKDKFESAASEARSCVLSADGQRDELVRKNNEYLDAGFEWKCTKRLGKLASKKYRKAVEQELIDADSEEDRERIKQVVQAARLEGEEQFARAIAGDSNAEKVNEAFAQARQSLGLQSINTDLGSDVESSMPDALPRTTEDLKEHFLENLRVGVATNTLTEEQRDAAGKLLQAACDGKAEELLEDMRNSTTQFDEAGAAAEENTEEVVSSEVQREDTLIAQASGEASEPAGQQRRTPGKSSISELLQREMATGAARRRAARARQRMARYESKAGQRCASNCQASSLDTARAHLLETINLPPERKIAVLLPRTRRPKRNSNSGKDGTPSGEGQPEKAAPPGKSI